MVATRHAVHSAASQRVSRLLVKGRRVVGVRARRPLMVADQPKLSWRERRKAAKRAQAERTGDTPEKRHDGSREGGSKETVDDAATRTGIASGGFGGS
jgi:hypothetical protein